MKTTVVYLVISFFAISLHSAVKVDKIDPPFWFTGMKNSELQLMIYGDHIAEATVQLAYQGVSIKECVTLDSPNYLLLYLTIDETAKPGSFDLLFSMGKKKMKVPYELKARQIDPEQRKGFDASDALYLLMPDRFANGNPSNDEVKGMAPYTVDRSDPNARHGGDLKGVENHLDYFVDLGVTALWFTPVLENNMEGGSYHGYATTDYYKVDPRLGTNEEYSVLIGKAHEKGIKMVMDMIFNHCGFEHPWVKDMPAADWFNNPDYEHNFVQTAFMLTPLVDPYASQQDFALMSDGWFVKPMPDLNQRNPHLLRYLIQNSFWWIEYAGIDGIRMDTYPYADYEAMSRWMQELNTEYPHYNVVGETWVTEPAYTAWWQKDSKLSAPLNSHLKTVMDFSLFDKMNAAKAEDSRGFGRGFNRIYNNFVYDFLYPNPSMVLSFYENHDTDRFLGNGEHIDQLKQVLLLLLTTPRIPQLYYGTEVMMNGTKEVSDGYVRKDFPGGWSGDEANAFTAEGRTVLQHECYNYFRKLLHWRKGNDAIAKGRMIQFISQHGVYVYARQHEGKTVLVLLNGTDEEIDLPLKHYAEVLRGISTAKDVITDRTVALGESLVFQPREVLLLEL